MSHLPRRIAPVLPLLLLLAAPLAAKPRWVPLGPYGGSVERLAVDPSDSLVVYALTSEKVLFKSTDGGTSWKPLRMFYDRSITVWSGGFVNNIAVDPARHGTVYLTADERLFKSVDGGASWAAVGPRTASSISAVSVDPARAGRVYAGGGGVWVSNNRGTSWKPARSSFGYVNQIIAVKQPAGTVYATAGDSGVYKSVDAGLTWRALALPSGSRRVGVFAVAPSESRRLYAGFEYRVSEGHYSFGLFRSTDGGATWQLTNRQPAATDEILSLAVSPRSPRTLWLATQRRGLFRSSDGGDTWTASGPASSSRVAVVAVAPSSPRTVYAGLTPWGTDAGGVFASTDTGRTWAPRNRGLFGVRVTAPALDPSDPEALWVGHQGGLYHSTNAGADWERMALPPARGVAVDPLAPSTVYALCGSSLWRTLDGGAAWTYLHASGLPTEGLSLLRIAPNDPSKLGGLGRALWEQGVWIFMSADAGEHWQHPEHPSAQCGLFDLAFAPSAPSTLYVAGSLGPYCVDAASGAFYRSSDGGATWSDLSSGLRGFPLDTAWRIAVDPVDPRLVYLASLARSHWAECNGVLKSTDGGSTWVQAGGLTDCITSVAASPIAGVVWASTEEGRVFRSGNGGATWRERTPGLLAQEVYELVIDPKVPGRVYAATSGGLWVWRDETP